MERRIDLENLDLDAFVEAIESRRATWTAEGLTAAPVTWVDNEVEWPRPLTTDRREVLRPMSAGLNVRGPDGAEAQFVLYAGGWGDVEYYIRPGSDDFGTEYVEVDSSGDFIAVVDRIVGLLRPER